MTRHESLQAEISASKLDAATYHKTWIILAPFSFVSAFFITAFAWAIYPTAVLLLLTFCFLVANMREAKRTEELTNQLDSVPVLYRCNHSGVHAYVKPYVWVEARKKSPRANLVVCDEYFIFTDRSDVPERTGTTLDEEVLINQGEVHICREMGLYVVFSNGKPAPRPVRVVPLNEARQYIFGR